MSLADKIISDIEGLPVGDGDGSENYELADFQKEWIIGAFAEGINRAALSLGRGGGKSGLLSALAALCLIPGKALYAPNFSCAAFASAFKQGKIIGEGVTGILQFLEIEGAYWITNNQNNFHVIHKKSKATLQCHGSDPRRAHGLKPNLLLGDELAQWPPSTGPRLWSALATSLGKKKGARLLCIGTRPVEETHFFEILLKDKSPDVFSLTYAADPEKDDPFDPASWRKANPGLDRDMPELSIIRSEAERARQDPQELAQFRALRLNMGTSDVALEGFLLDPENWRAIEGTPDCRGSYVLGIDLGGSEAFTAAAAVFETGGIACLQACGGHESLAKKEERENLPPRYYQKMRDEGELLQLGDRVVPPGEFLAAIEARWGRPAVIVCDRFRKAELLDALNAAGWRVPFLLRGMGYKDGSEDVRLFRRAALDKMITAPASWGIRSALSGARVVSDVSGNSKLAKGSEGKRAKTHRDDLAAALILACAEHHRRRTKAGKPRPRPRVVSMVDLPPQTEKPKSKGFKVVGF